MQTTDTSPPTVARSLFAPLAPGYERCARLLSLGQDGRWRRAMIDEVRLPAGSHVLDVAAGTGSMTRLLQAEGHRVISLDQSPEMLEQAHRGGATVVLGTGERLPFGDATFDGVTFGYLLRYVTDVPGALAELCRVLRPGGVLGMVEFGRPSGPWRPAWWLYTRMVLPAAGAVIGSGWYDVGRFLGPSIDRFADAHPPDTLMAEWRHAGLVDVRLRILSLGGGVVMRGRRSWAPT